MYFLYQFFCNNLYDVLSMSSKKIIFCKHLCHVNEYIIGFTITLNSNGFRITLNFIFSYPANIVPKN